MKFTNTLLGLGVGLFAGSAAALSLGEAHGHVVLGRPIDLVFDIQTDPGTELDVACITASVMAGETHIDSSGLRIAALPVVAGRTPSVRIRSFTVVVEPILRVRLAVGCSSVVARTYDFFTHTSIDAASGSLPLDAANEAPVRKAVRSPAADRERHSGSLGAALPSALPTHPPSTPPSHPPKPSNPVTEWVPPKTAAAAAAQPRSRLTVEPGGDWLAEPASAPAEQRAQATALLQALTTADKDLQKAQTQLQQQQAEIDAGRASREKMQGMVTDLQQRLERLDSEHFSATLVYGLLALLVVVCTLLGWLWLRLRAQTSAQRSNLDKNYSQALKAKDVAVASDESTESALMLSMPAFSPGMAKAEFLTPAAAPVAAPAPQTVPLERETTLTAAPTQAQAVRVLHPEDLFDLQQQAEFFVSVGEHDQAIEVMQKHIDENGSASPLMCLELLRLYRSLSRIDSFKHLRAQFQQHFNALVPEFAAFQEGGRTLLDYPETVASIEAVWSDAAVLPLLENCIFCRSNSPRGAVEPFELPAYDDLLLLYAIASTTSARARGAPPPRPRTTPYADAAKPLKF